MNFVAVIYVVSFTLMLLGIFMASAIPVAYLMGDSLSHIVGFAISAILPVVVGGVLVFITHKKDLKYGVREGFGIVAFTWLALGIFGSVPYMLVENFSWYDAFFETVSGFTTTGASVIDNTLILANGTTLPHGVESISPGLLYWRSMTHWIGGMGVVILSVAILPFLGLGTQNLVKAEATGPTSSQLTPRITSAAKLLWGFYFLLTLVLTVLLRAADMSWFDAWNHACSTVATGGFSTKAASIAAFNSHTINWIITFFMFLAGINFILHLKALRGHPFLYFKDEEVRWYIIVIGSAIGIITLTSWILNAPLLMVDGSTLPSTILNSIEHASFTVVAIITTTGFATIEYSTWGVLCMFVILLLMVIGGCGGSTAGGLKQSRGIILIKYAVAQIEYCLFPHSKPNVRVNHARVELAAVYKTLGFFVLYAFIVFVSTFLLLLMCVFIPEIAEQMNFETAFSVSISCLSNVGPALGSLSPSNTYSWLPDCSKIFLSILMIIGRLEFFTILVLLLPGFWRK